MQNTKKAALPATLKWHQLQFLTVQNDNPHMTGFTVKYEGNHAIVSGFSPKYGQCRADYYWDGDNWVLGAN